MRAARAVAVATLLAAAAPAAAVQPGEVLPDAALEARARALSAGLRCVVCRSENIDESNADIARDLRLLVRERLVAGETDAEVLAYVTDRYGEYVLLRPDVRGANLLLWLAGPLALVAAGGVAAAYLRGRSGAATADEEAATQLDRAEAERLARLLER